jgi:hypothetical protein
MAGIGKQFKGSGIAKINSMKNPSSEGVQNLYSAPGMYKTPRSERAAIFKEVRKKAPLLKKGGSVKPGLWANINKRKKLGISRPKSESTISKKAYSNMKKGFPK